MARGGTSPVGAERVSANGYRYVKVSDGEWRLKHHIVAEKYVLGRPLKDDERVTFKDKDRKNLAPDNIVVVKKGTRSTSRRKAQLLARRAEIDAQLSEL